MIVLVYLPALFIFPLTDTRDVEEIRKCENQILYHCKWFEFAKFAQKVLNFIQQVGSSTIHNADTNSWTYHCIY